MQTTKATLLSAPGAMPASYRVEITEEHDHAALAMVWDVEIRDDSGEVEDSTQTLVSAEWHGEGRDGDSYVEDAEWDDSRVSDPEHEVAAYESALDAYREERDIGWCPRCPRGIPQADGSTLYSGPIQRVSGLCPEHAAAQEVAA